MTNTQRLLLLAIGRAIAVGPWKLNPDALRETVYAVEQEPMIAEGRPSWQPIETLTLKDAELFFWIVPKTPEESYCNTSGNPIFSGGPPRLFLGKFQAWSSLEKATHWMLPPAAPAAPPEPLMAQLQKSLGIKKP